MRDARAAGRAAARQRETAEMCRMVGGGVEEPRPNPARLAAQRTLRDAQARALSHLLVSTLPLVLRVEHLQEAEMRCASSLRYARRHTHQRSRPDNSSPLTRDDPRGAALLAVFRFVVESRVLVIHWQLKFKFQ